MKHTFLAHEIQGYTKQRVFSIKLGIIGLVLIAVAVGLMYIAKTVVFAQQALDVTDPMDSMHEWDAVMVEVLDSGK